MSEDRVCDGDMYIGEPTKDDPRWRVMVWISVGGELRPEVMAYGPSKGWAMWFLNGGYW